MLNYIPLIVIVIGLAVMAVFLLRKKGSGHLSRENAFKEFQWSYEKGSSAYVIGENPENAALNFTVKGSIKGSDWAIKSYLYLQINNTTHNPYSIFRFEKGLIENNYFYAVPNLQANIKADYLAYLPKINIGNILSKFNIEMSLIEKLKLVETRNDFFDKNFYIYSSDESQARKVTGKDTQFYLNNFTNKVKDPAKWPSISITPDCLEIKILWTLEKPEDIKAFADFGIAIIKNI